MSKDPREVPHPYISTWSNGSEVLNSCVKCGLPKSNTTIHIAEPDKTVKPPPEPPKQPTQNATLVVLSQVLVERQRQDKKFGPQTKNTDLYWLGIEGEEFAEMSQRYAQAARLVLHPEELGQTIDKAVAELREELIQVAAVAVAWIEGIDSRRPKA